MYLFDDPLRMLFFRYICIVEITIRSRLSYAFCELYGESQSKYLDIRNYNVKPSNREDIEKLLRMLKYEANSNKHPYVVYQHSHYGNVPLWVLVHALEFGKLSRLYEYSMPAVKSRVASGFTNINDRELSSILKNLVLYRNVCGHHERLYSHKIYTDFPDTRLHQKLSIPKKGNQYTKGKRDLFGVVIALRYLLTKEEFIDFKKQLSKIIDKYIANTQRVEKDWLYEEMGFPANWKSITRYKL